MEEGRKVDYYKNILSHSDGGKISQDINKPWLIAIYQLCLITNYNDEVDIVELSANGNLPLKTSYLS